jgi:hypothetical protein
MLSRLANLLQRWLAVRWHDCFIVLWALICNSVHGSDYPTDLSVLTYGDIAHGLKGLETSASTFLSRNDRFDARYTFS